MEEKSDPINMLMTEDKQDLAMLRRLRGESLRDIAQDLGVSHPTVAKWVEVAEARIVGYARGAGISLDSKEPNALLLACAAVMASGGGATSLKEVREEAAISPGGEPRGTESEISEQVGNERVEPIIKKVVEENAENKKTESNVVWPMSQDEMEYLARTHHAEHYQPETWPCWAKRLEVQVDPKVATQIMEMFPDEEYRDRVVYETMWGAIHTGKDSHWEWNGVNLTMILPQLNLGVWCQMRNDGKTTEIKFIWPAP